MKSLKPLATLSAITGLVTICFQAQAIYVMASIQNPANGYTYDLLSPASWTASQSFAQTLGGNLATVNDATLNQWIYSSFFPLTPLSTTDTALWIGLYDPTQDANGGSHVSNFVWVDGTPVSYSNWYPGQPDDTGGVEFYTAMRSPDDQPLPGTWNDLPNSGGGSAGNIYGVAMIVPEPNIIALFGLGMIALVAVRCKRAATA